METVTDIAMHECFVIHVLDNRLPAVQCSQALTPLPETLRASLHRYLLALLKPQFRRKRYGRFRRRGYSGCGDSDGPLPIQKPDV